MHASRHEDHAPDEGLEPRASGGGGALSSGLTIGIATWVPVIGLTLGGAVAAPTSAIFARRIPARPLMITVGVLVIALSIRTIVLALR